MFLIASGLLYLVGLIFTGFFLYVVLAYDSLLDGSVFSFLIPTILANILLVAATTIGICGARREHKNLIVCQIIMLALLLLYGIISSVFVITLAGEASDAPGIGEYITNLKVNFEVQVFNNCCVTQLGQGDETSLVVDCDLANANTTNNAIDALETVQCVEETLGWSNIVSDQLCSALILQEDSFVGDIDDGNCGGEELDFVLFQETFREFTDPIFSNFSTAVILLTAFIFCVLVASIFQCNSMQGRKTEGGVKKRNSYMLGDPNYDKDTRPINVYQAGTPAGAMDSSVDRFYMEPSGEADAAGSSQENVGSALGPFPSL